MGTDGWVPPDCCGTFATLYARKRQDTQHGVHISLNPHPDDRFTDMEMANIAQAKRFCLYIYCGSLCFSSRI